MGHPEIAAISESREVDGTQSFLSLGGGVVSPALVPVVRPPPTLEKIPPRLGGPLRPRLQTGGGTAYGGALAVAAVAPQPEKYIVVEGKKTKGKGGRPKPWKGGKPC